MIRRHSLTVSSLVGVAVVALVAGTMQPVQAHQATRPAGAVRTAQLRAQLRGGQLAANHGAVKLCAVHGLHCDLQVVTRSRSSNRPLTTAAPLGYGPAELDVGYGIPATPKGEGLIAVIDAGAYPRLAADTATYRRQYGLGPCTVASGCLRQRNFLGGAPYPPVDTTNYRREAEEYSGFETILDVEMVMASCPGCRVVEIQVPLRDSYDGGIKNAKESARHVALAVQLARRLGARAVSMSITLSSYAYSDHKLLPMMTTPGMALVASSGDDGDLPSAAWPQNLPTVTSVGGASLYRADTPRGWSDKAWRGAGSSCDHNLTPAEGQPVSISSICTYNGRPHRASSDVSADADPYTGVAVYDSYAPYSHQPAGWVVIGGTSASAPWIAGLYGRAPARPDVLGPNTVYAAPRTAFHDVTTGETSKPGTCGLFSPDPLPLCHARPGWDGPTGLGVPNGLAAF